MPSSSESTEDDVDDGPRDVNLVVGLSTFEVEKFHTDGLRSEDGDEVICRDSILRDEPFEDVEAFRCDLIDTSILEVERSRIGSVLDQSSVHEVLTDPLCDIPRHGEGSRRGSGDDTLRVVGIGGTIRLREAEGSEIGGSVIGGESVGVGSKESGSI